MVSTDKEWCYRPSMHVTSWKTSNLWKSNKNFYSCNWMGLIQDLPTDLLNLLQAPQEKGSWIYSTFEKRACCQFIRSSDEKDQGRWVKNGPQWGPVKGQTYCVYTVLHKRRDNYVNLLENLELFDVHWSREIRVVYYSFVYLGSYEWLSPTTTQFAWVVGKAMQR